MTGKVDTQSPRNQRFAGQIVCLPDLKPCEDHYGLAGPRRDTNRAGCRRFSIPTRPECQCALDASSGPVPSRSSHAVATARRERVYNPAASAADPREEVGSHMTADAQTTEPTDNLDLTLVRELVDARLDLEHQIAAVLIRLELISYGSTTAWNSSGGESGEPDDKIISQVSQIGRDTPRHLHYRDMYDHAGSDAQRRRVIAAAEEELARIVRQSAAAVSVQSDADILRDRIVREGAGWTAAEVARTFRCTVGHVRRVRNECGRDGETGQVLELHIMDRATLARQLAAKGISHSEVARQMGIPRTTVIRLLRTERKAAA